MPAIATASGTASSQGIIDVLGSDHAPHTLEEKAKTYPASPSGMTGVQTLVPLMLDHVNAGRLSLARFVDLTERRPRAAVQHRHARAASRRAMTPTSPWSISSARETITNNWVASKRGLDAL